VVAVAAVAEDDAIEVGDPGSGEQPEGMVVVGVDAVGGVERPRDGERVAGEQGRLVVRGKAGEEIRGHEPPPRDTGGARPGRGGRGTRAGHGRGKRRSPPSSRSPSANTPSRPGATSRCACRRARRSGRATSSASWKATQSPLARARPRLRAAARPAWAARTT